MPTALILLEETMKALVLFTAFLLTSTLAFAYPALNDQATFTGTYTQGAQQIPVTLMIQLVQYDAAQQAYMQRSTTTANGQAQSHDEWVPEADMMTPDKVQQIISTCDSQGGHTEMLPIAGQTIQTCALPVDNADEQATYWIADVPFGIAKAEISDKKSTGHTSLTMQSHQ
jgi:hypothetical protein